MALPVPFSISQHESKGNGVGVIWVEVKLEN